MKNSKVHYSLEVYDTLLKESKAMNLQGILNKQFKNPVLSEEIESELIKMMSLVPKELTQKMQRVNQCAVNSNNLTSTEALLINDLISAYALVDLSLAQKCMHAMFEVPTKSDTFETIVSNMFNTNGKSLQFASSQNDRPLPDLGTGVGIAIGGVIGFIVGGPLGAAIGAVAGGFIGRAIGKLISIFSKGVVAGPNGEDCTRPILLFP